ncbi:sulfotransferase 1B1-like isoform X2 [Haliotis rufescens]|nr:sulfotransferase 1B1-like isoform X2 [Haliotis rufescens]XP_046360226.1 sulfotransferase 1B1-like isoform X2 [Haliotis rufescens]XP_046360227.1 sulfotransferase 1B1-like isoform X2 [Haliotis rufescens]XP_048241272.1 sulfotransferase 1B1-like isoform X2 [Haliotis rufescens]
MSSLKKLTDKGGNSVYTHCIDGHYFPPFPLDVEFATHLENIKKMNIRDDDVIIVGYAKSGTHWMWEVAGMLVAGSTDYIRQLKEHQFIESKEVAVLDALTSPRLLNTHMAFRFLPSEVVSKRTKVIYLLRNPKDVAVSLYHHVWGMNKDNWVYNGTWDDFLDAYLQGNVWCGSWFDSVLDWEKTRPARSEMPVFTLHYEDMKKDPLSNVQRLSEFLEAPASSEFCQRVVEACSFKKLKQAKDNMEENFLRDIWKPGCEGFYRKGEVGDWKNWFTVAQNERFDAVYGEKMKHSKLKMQFE